MSCVPLFLSVFQENRSGPRAAPTILFYGFSQEGPLWCSSCGPQSINLIIGCAASFGNIIGAHHKMVLLAYNQVTESHRIVDRHFFKPVRHGISVRIKKADVISARARGICNYKCHSLGICGKISASCALEACRIPVQFHRTLNTHIRLSSMVIPKPVHLFLRKNMANHILISVGSAANAGIQRENIRATVYVTDGPVSTLLLPTPFQ